MSPVQISSSIPFKFRLSKNNRSCEPQSRSIEGIEDAKLECGCSFKYLGGSIWRFCVKVVNFKEFRNKNVVAFGTAVLDWEKESFDESMAESSDESSDDMTINEAYDELKNYLFHMIDEADDVDEYLFDLEQIELQSLQDEKVWRFQGELEDAVECTVLLRITLIYHDDAAMSDKMRVDFVDALESGLYSDFVLVSDKKQFMVHKIILSVRSTVFKAMFAANMREEKDGKVVIEDVKADVLEEMLKFIYTGIFKDGAKPPGFLEDLYDAAEKYDISDLKMVVSKQLCQSTGITVENVLKRLNLAEQFGDRDLRKCCLDFINDNSGLLAEHNVALL